MRRGRNMLSLIDKYRQEVEGLVILAGTNNCLWKSTTWRLISRHSTYILDRRLPWAMPSIPMKALHPYRAVDSHERSSTPWALYVHAWPSTPMSALHPCLVVESYERSSSMLGTPMSAHLHAGPLTPMSTLCPCWVVDPHESSTSMLGHQHLWAFCVYVGPSTPISTLRLYWTVDPHRTIYHHMADPALSHKIINKLNGNRLTAITEATNCQIVGGLPLRTWGSGRGT